MVQKINVPPLRGVWVARPQLIEQLEAGMSRKVTLVAAGAGWGKSVLLRQWANSNSHDILWLDFSPADNTPEAFWRYTMEMLAHFTKGDRFSEALLAYNRHLAIVFENFHHITHPDILSDLSAQLDRIPNFCHMYLLTRQQPRLPLGELRAANQLIELNEALLAFNNQEGRSLLIDTMKILLKRAEVDFISRRMDGWAAGYGLLGQRLQKISPPSIPPFLESFSGEFAGIREYFALEVFSKLPEQIQAFLLSISILDDFNVPICEAITLDTTSAQHLQLLLEQHCFVLYVDDQMYRLQRLFMEFLRYEVAQQTDMSIATLHERAATWYIEHHNPDRAIHHFLAIQAFSEALQWMLPIIYTHLIQENFPLLAKWFAALPESFFQENITLAFARIWVAIYAGHSHEYEIYMAAIEDDFDAATLENHQVEVLALQVAITSYTGDEVKTIQLAEKAMQMYGPNDWYAHAMCLSALNRLDIYDASIEVYHAMSINPNNVPLQLKAAIRVANRLYINGELSRAAEFSKRGLALTGGAALAVANYPIIPLYHNLAYICLEHYEVDQALDYAERAFRIAEECGKAEQIVASYDLFSQIYWAKGDKTSALDFSETCLAFVENISVPALVRLGHIQSARLYLLNNQLEEVRHWFKHFQINPDTASPYELMTYCWASIVLGGSHLHFLEKLMAKTQEQQKWGLYIEQLALYTLGFCQLGETRRAQQTLAEAVALGYKEGFLFSIAQFGADMIPVLQEITNAEHTVEQSNYLLNLFQHLGGNPKKEEATSKQIQLSQQERRILKLMDEGMTYREMAMELRVSYYTINAHTKNMYRKMGVRNRTQAIQYAYRLGFLP